MIDKGAVISLEEGVEGFATPKHLQKQDGSQPKLGETLDFKVIEFKKDNRRIILSHSRIFEDEQKAEQRKANAEKRAAAKAAAAEKAATPMPTIERTTLGDIDALAALRDKLALIRLLMVSMPPMCKKARRMDLPSMTVFLTRWKLTSRRL